MSKELIKWSELSRKLSGSDNSTEERIAEIAIIVSPIIFIIGAICTYLIHINHLQIW